LKTETVNRLQPAFWRKKPFIFTMIALIILMVGVVDFLTGFEISFSVFYLLAIGLAAWFAGRGFAISLSVLSVLIWLTGDYIAGAHYSNGFVPVWNAAISLASYLIVVWLLRSLRSLYDELETRVKQRTSALAAEIAERARLENELLNVGERERQRLGHDLHDSLGQQLTAIALAGRVLQEKLVSISLPATVEADKLVQLVEQAVDLTRKLSRGIAPVELTGEGLMDSLRELTANTERLSKINCDFFCEKPVIVTSSSVAVHLFRIAQEAVNNAIKHAKPTQITIHLSSNNGGIELVVEDNGAGIPIPLSKDKGMGLQIMKHRADMIGASFAVQRLASEGTSITCTLQGSL